MNVALRSEHLNILSICTGGAGLDLGVELAIPSARTVCMVEREAFSVATLVSAMEQGLLHPAPVWSDARTFDGRAWRGAVDGLIGGIPCQPHSLAGRKQGSHDARDLWSTARRIIVQSGVWFVVIENVGGMLAAGSDEIAGAQRVFRDLHKLGFEVEGGLFTAAEVGSSHQRERIIILAVADPSIRASERWGGAGDVVRACKPTEGQAQQRQRRGRASGDSGEGLAHPDSVGQRGEGHGTIKAGPMLVARGEPVDDASIARSGSVPVQPRRQDEACCNIDRPVDAMVHPIGRGRAGWQEVAQRRSRQRTADEWSSRPTLFPPGPNDLDSWRDILAASTELEPAFRRVADGLASRLDIGRVDRLRMLGNGVVPLQAAYAVRTLATRLAARGSAGATRLVRMMEGIAE